MEFQVNTNNVILSQIDQVESGEYNVTECNFTFSSEFDGLTKKAVFTGEDGTAYLQTIVDNKCSIPSEILEVSQVVEIGVYAYDVENEELVLRYSPEPTQFYIHQGSYKEGKNSTPPTPSEVEQLQAQITSNKNDIEEIQGDVVDINQDIVDIKAEQITQNTSIHNNADNIETINEQISDINETITNLETNKANVTDLNALTERVSTNERDIDTIDGHISDINQNIDDLEQDLTNYSLITETGSQINLNVNSTNYQITAILKDKNGNVIYTSNAIDLPIESMIVNARYDNTTKEIVLTLQNGNTLRISVADLVSGLVSETQLQTILANYYTKTEVDNLLSAKANQTSLDATNQNLSNLAGRVSTNEEDIAEIKTEQTTQNTNIEALQNKVEELETENENLRKALPQIKGQGTDITLENTSENKFVELGLNGNTDQEQLKGVNLTEHDEITLLDSNEIILCDFGEGRTFNKLSITIICDNATFTNETSAFIAYINENDQIQYQGLNKWGVSTRPVTGTFVRTFENVIVKQIILKNWCNLRGQIKLQIQDGEPTAWEPYTNGLQTPNPNYIEPIKNVTGNANVKIQNKNLLNIADGNTLTTKSFDITDFVEVGKTYSFSAYLDLKNTTSTAQARLRIDKYIGTEVSYLGGTLIANKSKGISKRENVTLESSVTKVVLTIQSYGVADFNCDYSQIMGEQGTTATSYVEHQEQNYPFTFAEGQRAMQGTTLQDDGIHNIRKQYAITGNETWELFNNKCVRVRKNDIKGVLDTTTLGDIKCNYLVADTQANVQKGVVDYGIAIRQEGTNGIVVRNKDFTTLEQYTNWFKQLYNNNAPLLIEYPLADSELENNIIPYNATQQAQYNAIKEAISYYKQTNISGSSDELSPIITATAVGDLNLILNT